MFRYLGYIRYGDRVCFIVLSLLIRAIVIGLYFFLSCGLL